MAIECATPSAHITPALSLNSLQQMMRKWAALSPYNAGHVMHLKGIADIERLKKITLITLQELKLGKPHFDRKEQQVTFESLQELTIDMPTIDLNAHIITELNRAFLPNDFPLRFFMISCDDDSYYFGVIYNHWIADSYSMRALFQRIYLRLQGKSSLSPLTLIAPPIRSIFQDQVGKFSWFDSVKEIIKCTLYFQSAYRIKLNELMNFETGFHRYDLPAGLIQRLLHYAKQQQVSINDLFLTTAARILSQHTYADRVTKKRKKLRFFPRNRLAIGTIVDTRHHVENKLDDVFGQYLSNYTVLLKKPESTTFNDLLKTIHSQTKKIKKTFQTIKNFSRWDLSLWIWDFLSSKKSQARFFNKSAPIIAGISNVNLTNSWIGENSTQTNGDILAYIRISPAGILLPLVFTLTTLHQQLSLCVTYRKTAFSAADINQICHHFVHCLEQLL